MKLFFAIAAVAAATIHSGAAESSKPSLVFREPFTLKLHVDKEHYYEESFGKIPYVADNDVYLFRGDAFGIDLLITNGVIPAIVYQPETNKASVILRFTQEVKDNGDAMMMLVIKNRSKHKLFMDALMTVPGKKGIRKTSILPIEPTLSGYESWPEPIVQLVLRNIRLTEKPGTEPSGPANGSQSVRTETNRQGFFGAGGHNEVIRVADEVDLVASLHPGEWNDPLSDGSVVPFRLGNRRFVQASNLHE